MTEEAFGAGMTLIENAVNHRPYPQLPFMSEQRFSSFLSDRGFNVRVDGIRSFVDAGLIERLGGEAGDFHPFQIWPISELFRLMGLNLDTGIQLCGFNTSKLKSFLDQNWSLRETSFADFPKSETCREFNQELLPLLMWIESYSYVDRIVFFARGSGRKARCC